MTFAHRITTRTHRLMTLPALLLIAACGGLTGRPVDESGPPPGGKVGIPDTTKTVRLNVDEAGVTGQVTGSTLRLQIPVSNPDALESAGSLAVAIISVDGAMVESKTVPFALGPGAGATLTADFNTPAGVGSQADWVKSSVLVTSPEVKDLQVTRSLLSALGNYEVRLEGPSTMVRGRQASFRVRTQDPLTNQIRANQPVQLVVRQNNAVVLTKDATTDAKGDAVFDVVLDSAGAVTVEALAKMQGTDVSVSDSATVKLPGNRVLLTTDKPIYQPGQTVYLRALALENLSKKPLSSQPVVFEIEDGKANKIFKRTLTSDAYGLAATQFRLGQVLNLGTFKVRVAVGADKSEKTIEVSRYALPKFNVQVSTDKPWYTPGAVVSGAIDANYFFGKALDRCGRADRGSDDGHRPDRVPEGHRQDRRPGALRLLAEAARAAGRPAHQRRQRRGQPARAGDRHRRAAGLCGTRP